VKQDIEQEIRADELKRTLNENKIQNPLKDVMEETKQAFSEIKEETGKAVDAAESLKSGEKGQTGGNASQP